MMQYLVGCAFLLAAVASPSGVNAQGTDKGWAEEFYPELAPREPPEPPPKGEDTTSEPSVVQEPAPSSGPTSKETALQLKVDDAGVKVAPPRTRDGYTLEEMNVRVKRAKIGLGVSAVVSAVAVGLSAAYFYGCLTPAFVDPNSLNAHRCTALIATGFPLFAVGAAGIITSGVLLARHKRERDSLRQARNGTPRRIQWDLARSRLVF